MGVQLYDQNLAPFNANGSADGYVSTISVWHMFQSGQMLGATGTRTNLKAKGSSKQRAGWTTSRYERRTFSFIFRKAVTGGSAYLALSIDDGNRRSGQYWW